ncbi:MAG: hypothetical protein PHC51_02685 [bacterium]|nr:hypothetical protein [bacterium]
MDRAVLGLFSSFEVEQRVSAVLKEESVLLTSEKETLSAKRQLLRHSPDLIIGEMSGEGGEESILKFFAELRGHESFRRIPLLAICHRRSSDLASRCQDAGAQGVITWPVDDAVLKQRLKLLLGQEAKSLLVDEEVTQALDIEPALEPLPVGVPSVLLTPDGLTADPAVEEMDGEMELKLKNAQRLLAMVLHNIRTSDLLRVSALEDVPRIVYEVTRKVCQQDTQQDNQQDKPVESELKTETSLQNVSSALDKIFGR